MIELPTPETDALDRELHNPRVLQDRYSEMMEHAQNMERERDEARESLKHITEYGTEEINAAIDLRQKLASALVERDEARKQVENQKVRIGEFFDALEKLTSERDEARGHCESIVDKANELIARWDMPSWKDTAPTARFINALRIAVKAYERQEP